MFNPTLPSHLRVALVYDWATTRYGGAEWLLYLLLETFPQAPLYTTIASPSLPWVNHNRIKTSFLQYLPSQNHRLLSPLMPIAIESLDLSGFDIVLSISTGIALGVLTRTDQLHVCYLLSPPRYIYHFDETYGDTRDWTSWFPINQGVNLSRKYLKWWQNQACLRPDVIIPLSEKVKKQAEQEYGREIDRPIYPAIPDRRSQVQQTIVDTLLQKTPFWLYVGRLVSYKQPLLCVQAALQAHHVLLMIGSGPEGAQVRKSAGSMGQELYSLSEVQSFLQASTSNHQPHIGFWSEATDVEVTQLMAAARVVLAPGIDDFGLVALESATLRTPCVYNSQSGVAEVLHSNQDGVAIEKLSLTSLSSAVNQAEQLKISNKRAQWLTAQFSRTAYLTALTTQLATYWYTRTHSAKSKSKEYLCQIKTIPTL